MFGTRLQARNIISRHISSKGVGDVWWDRDALIDADYTNGRFRYNGVSYADETSFNSAAGASKSGIQRIFGPYLVGPELTTDPGFASGVDGWDDNPAFAGNGSVSQSSGQLQISHTATNYRPRRPTTVLAGHSYAFSVKAVQMKSNSGFLSVSQNTDLGSAVSTAFTFNAINETKQIVWGAGGIGSFGASGTGYFGIILGSVTSPPQITILDDQTIRECYPYPGFVPGGFAARITGTTPAEASGNKVLATWGDSNSEINRVRIVWDATKHFRLIVTNATAEGANIDLGIVDLDTSFDIEITIADNRVAARVNGSTTISDIVAQIPGTGIFKIGYSNTGESWDGIIDRVRVYPTERATADLIYIEGDSYVSGASGVSLSGSLASVMSRAVFQTAVGGSYVSAELTRIQAHAGLLNGVFVSWDGDANTGIDPDEYLAYMALIAAEMKTSRYLFLPPLQRAGKTTQDNTNVAAIQAAMKAAYGIHYFDPLPSLFAIASSPGDDATVAAEQVPASLLQGDGVHLSSTAMSAVATAVAAQITAMESQIGDSAPINTSLPVITGTTDVGDTLRCYHNGWFSNAGNITYTYQWLRDAFPVSGATESTYTLTYDDGGADISCEVTATNAVGNTTAESNALTFEAIELVTNGDFNSATGWFVPSGWSITGGQAVASSAVAFATIVRTVLTPPGFVAGVTYTAVLEVDSVSAGGVRFAISGGTQVSGTTRTSAGTFTQDFVANASNVNINLQAGASGFTGAVGSLSIKKKLGWSSVLSEPYTFDARDWEIHSALEDWSIQSSAQNPSWLRFEVREGDMWSEDVGRDPSFDRAELVCDPGFITGDTEVWFSFAVRMWNVADNPTLPSGFTGRSIFQVFNGFANLQLHSLASGLQIWTYAITGDDVSTAVKTVRVTDDAMVDGVTEQFVFRAKFSPTAGELQVWRNGDELCNLSGISMGYTGTDWARPQLGLYRLASTATGRVEFVNFKMGSDLSAKVDTPDALPSDW